MAWAARSAVLDSADYDSRGPLAQSYQSCCKMTDFPSRSRPGRLATFRSTRAQIEGEKRKDGAMMACKALREMLEPICLSNMEYSFCVLKIDLRLVRCRKRC
jgi:hypothetical protein